MRHGAETSLPVEPQGLSTFLAEVGDAAERAAQATGGFQDVFCRLAGYVVRLRFAGPALVPLLAPALAHVRTRPVDLPALTVRLWDSESTATPLPRTPWGADAHRDAGRVHIWIDGSLNGIFWSHSFSMYQLQASEAIYWSRTPSDIDYSDTGSPLRTILQLWLSTRHSQIAHSGAVGDSAGCVLIVGDGGAGKSSTVLACIPSGLRILGDDYCILGPEERPTVHTLYSSAKVHVDTLARLPFLEPMVANPDRARDVKALCFLGDHIPDKLLERAALRAILIPRVTGRRETSAGPAPPGAALAALAPSTLLQLPGSDQATLGRLARAVRAVPCHYLDVGTDPVGIPVAIESLLRA